MWKYIFSIDVIGTILLVCVILYFIFTSNKPRGARKPFSWETPEFTGVRFPDPFVKPLKGKRGYQGRGMGKNEERCREIFQMLFHADFPSVRPKFLRNPATKKCLELDGYNEDIQTSIGNGLAFEYDGAQHATYNPQFHGYNKVSGEEQFKYQIIKDRWKDQECRKHGVLLIRIPHFVPYDDLEKFITSRLRQEHVL